MFYELVLLKENTEYGREMSRALIKRLKDLIDLVIYINSWTDVILHRNFSHWSLN